MLVPNADVQGPACVLVLSPLFYNILCLPVTALVSPLRTVPLLAYRLRVKRLRSELSLTVTGQCMLCILSKNYRNQRKTFSFYVVVMLGIKQSPHIGKAHVLIPEFRTLCLIWEYQTWSLTCFRSNLSKREVVLKQERVYPLFNQIEKTILDCYCESRELRLLHILSLILQASLMSGGGSSSSAPSMRSN